MARSSPWRRRLAPLLAALWGLSTAAVAQDKPRAEILWDTWGVPHIYAATDEDLFYAVGWATMHNHADVVLRLYGQARGRAAEYWGESYAESDRQVLILKAPERARSALAQQDPAFRAKLDAYAAGVNAYAAAHRDRIADEVEVVLPVTAADLLAHQQRSGVLPFAFAALQEETEAWKGRGSNAWAIGPKHSKSGNAMLVLNPHIPWGEAVFGGLFRVFEVDLKSPSLDFYGTLQVGGPVVSGGFSDHLGYTHTVNTLDDVDVYELTLADGGYLYDGAVRAFEETKTSFKVKGKDGGFETRPLTVRWSVHGPVVAEKPGKAMAVRLASLDLPFQYEQFWQMASSRSLDEFLAAVRRLQIPKSNLLYADAARNTFYLAGGRIPARTHGDYAFWAGMIDGATSKTLWTDYLPMEALPQALNPPAGWLQNANEPPWYVTRPAAFTPEQFPAWMSPRRLGLRPQRSLRMMTDTGPMSFEEVAADKLSTRSELA
ncbi:MAG TPA: penicillin acylase family protein, partial [Caulobacteraceae bacterium]|nr:penicillin acylase family protein [Caulobacteraceae bacterium]